MASIPRVGHEVTTEWLQKILQDYERKFTPNCKLRVTELNAQAGSVPGASFNSDLSIVDAKAKFNVDADSPEEEKEYHLYMKFHSLNAVSRESNVYSKSHKKETSLYSDVYPELTLLQEREANGMYPLGLPIAYFSYAKRDDYVLVLENLLYRGYKVSDKRKGLSFNQLELALTQLARLHALSYALNKKTNFIKAFPQFKMSDKYIKFISLILEVGVTNLRPLLEQSDQYEEMIAKITDPSALMREFLDQMLDKDPTKIRCLIHGDFWNNNMLFKYDESSMPYDIKIIDWQNSYWGRPVVDIHCLVYSSTTCAVRQNHINHLLKLYHGTFHDITVALKCPHPGYTFEVFTKEFMEASILGFIFGVTLTQGTLGKCNEKLNPVQTVSPRNPLFKIRCWLTRALLLCMTQPSLNFLVKAMVKKMFRPVKLEIIEGQNHILNERLLGLVVEAKQRGYLNSVNTL